MIYLAALVVCYFFVAFVATVVISVQEFLAWRRRRRPVEMIAPLPVASVHLATAYRRDPLRVRRGEP